MLFNVIHFIVPSSIHFPLGFIKLLCIVSIRHRVTKYSDRIMTTTLRQRRQDIGQWSETITITRYPFLRPHVNHASLGSSEDAHLVVHVCCLANPMFVRFQLTITGIALNAYPISRPLGRNKFRLASARAVDRRFVFAIPPPTPTAIWPTIRPIPPAPGLMLY